MDLYFKKEIPYKFYGLDFRFDIGNTLFSTYDIDKGTDVLLRYIDAKNPKSILDIGCGCGVIGIVLAKRFPESRVTCIDKDLLAVRYTRINAEKNYTPNVDAIGSIATENVADKKFDLIISNIPAKIGDRAIEHDFILKPLELLNPGGTLWIVVVAGLNRLIPKLGRKHKLHMQEVKKRSGHSVYRINKI
jgi:16S rRNA (guanine1207-N2)-methyltransferase